MSLTEGLTEDEVRVLTAITAAGTGGLLFSTLTAEMEQSRASKAMRGLLSLQKIRCDRVVGSSSNEHILTLKRAAMPENTAAVLDCIRSAGPSGVDASTITSRVKLAKPEVAKALSTLLQQNLVKDARCFTNKTRKVYVLAELQPSVDVTGGTFYTEGRDIDTAFIDSVRSRAIACFKQRGVVTPLQLKQQLDSEPGARRLSQEEISTILRVMELDGCLSKIGEETYRLNTAENTFGDDWGLRFPCLGCPQLGICSPDALGTMNPISCEYLRKWLS